MYMKHNRGRLVGVTMSLRERYIDRFVSVERGCVIHVSRIKSVKDGIERGPSHIVVKDPLEECDLKYLSIVCKKYKEGVVTCVI